MVTPLIKPAELILLSTYLHDLQAFVSGGKNDRSFYRRWKSQIEPITEIITRLDTYLAAKDSEAAQKVKYAKHLAYFQGDEYTVYNEHIPYYLTGIIMYQQEIEAELIQNGLMDKIIQEMTGFEFKTLLLATLKEHQDRKGN